MESPVTHATPQPQAGAQNAPFLLEQSAAFALEPANPDLLVLTYADAHYALRAIRHAEEVLGTSHRLIGEALDLDAPVDPGRAKAVRQAIRLAQFALRQVTGRADEEARP